MKALRIEIAKITYPVCRTVVAQIYTLIWF
jgi:hypothetical protein